MIIPALVWYTWVMAVPSIKWKVEMWKVQQ